MRYLLCDRVLEIEKGKRIVGVKTFSEDEDIFRPYSHRKAIVPITLVIESLGQLGSWLVKFTLDFTIEPVVGLIEGVIVTRDIESGNQLLIETEILTIDSKSSNIYGIVKYNNEIVITVERILFGHLSIRDDPIVIQQRFSILSNLLLMDG